MAPTWGFARLSVTHALGIVCPSKTASDQGYWPEGENKTVRGELRPSINNARLNLILLSSMKPERASAKVVPHDCVMLHDQVTTLDGKCRLHQRRCDVFELTSAAPSDTACATYAAPCDGQLLESNSHPCRLPDPCLEQGIFEKHVHHDYQAQADLHNTSHVIVSPSKR